MKSPQNIELVISSLPHDSCLRPLQSYFGMSFKFSLKGKISKPAQKAESHKRKSLADDVKPTVTKNVIDTFDSKQGAMLGKVALSHKPKLTIQPIYQSSSLRRKTKASNNENSSNSTIDRSESTNEAALSLINGEILEETSNRVIDIDLQSNQIIDHEFGAENTQKDYEDVPVDEFGAALLRGMGWKGPDKKNPSMHLSHRQRGAVLGIGAKSINKDLEMELLDRKNLSVPLIKRE